MTKVTFIIPTLNAEKFIINCLFSIYKQSVSRNNYEVFILDGGSSDKTTNIAEKFKKILPLIIINNKKVDAESGKRLGIKMSNGKYICLLDADNEIHVNKWLEDAILAFEENYQIWGVESNWITNKNDSLVNQYFSMLKIADPVAKVFSPSYKKYLKSDHSKYSIISVDKDATPIIGANGFFYRKRLVEKEITKTKKFEEVNYVAELISNGYTDYALLKRGGIYHDYCHSIRAYARKRKKIANKFLKRKSIKQKTWVDKVGKDKFIISILYNLSFVGPLIESIINIVKSRNIAWIIHPLISFLTVVIYAYYYILNKINYDK